MHALRDPRLGEPIVQRDVPVRHDHEPEPDGAHPLERGQDVRVRREAQRRKQGAEHVVDPRLAGRGPERVAKDQGAAAPQVRQSGAVSALEVVRAVVGDLGRQRRLGRLPVDVQVAARGELLAQRGHRVLQPKQRPERVEQDGPDLQATHSHAANGTVSAASSTPLTRAAGRCQPRSVAHAASHMCSGNTTAR